VARRANNSANGRRFRYRRWTCHILAEGNDHADIRCTRAAGRVVRWQIAA
jgi:hypothetical protein